MSNEVHFTPHTPKHELFAHLINLIFPGVGLAYWRRDSSGFAWCSLTLIMSMLSVTLWLLYPILPQLFLAIFTLMWITIEWIVFDEVRSSRPDQPTWQRRAQGVLSYLGGATLCLVSTLLVFYVGLTRVYGFVYVHHDSMFPQLLSGDTVLIDRRVTSLSDLRIGQLIVYESKAHGALIARVIALREQTRVEMSGHRVSLSDTQLELTPRRVEMEHLIDADRQRLRANASFFEYDQEGKAKWLISQSNHPLSSSFRLSTSLGKNTLLVLPDMRYAQQDGTQIVGEVVDRNRLIGIPVMIVSSHYPHPKASTRRGIKLQ